MRSRLGRAGGAVEIAESEEHEGRGHGAEEEVFDARLLRDGRGREMLTMM